MVSVFFTNTSATTALHSINPLPHINNDPSTVSNELNDLIDAHLTTLTQHAGVSDPSHPHSLLLRVLHQQFTEHLELQLYNLRQYTTHQQLLIHQFVGNSPPHYPNPDPDPNPDPNPNPNSNQRTTNPPPRRQRYLCYAVRKGIANEFKGFKTLHDAQTYLDSHHSPSVPE